MKLLFAGCEKKRFRNLLKEEGAKDILVSFFYLNPGETQKIKDEGFEFIFIDSGGYTARKQGKMVDVVAYRRFLEQNKDLISTAANLDVLDLNEALDNQQYLSEVYPVLPVYHFAEYAQKKLDLLEDFCKNHPFIALGGVAGVTIDKKAVTNFFNYCFKIIMKYKGLKVHGFGITSFDILKQYPFYSVDSTAWLTGGQYGIMVKWEDSFRMKTTLHPSMKEQMIERNIPIEMLGEYEPRLRNNIREFLKMQTQLTRLWALRGIEYAE